jgi:predicted 3-demethylubiquinone-9 3-methyltransferase (glyoxalase superfamily)
MSTRRPKITPCLWFNFNAEEAVDYYISLFPDSRVVSKFHYNDSIPDLKGKVLMIEFELAGERFLALNGGPQFPFTNAISLSIDCEDQAEVDRVWQRITADGGEPGDCGWIKDKYGLSWQVVPRGMVELFADDDPDRAARAMRAMMTMGKLDIAQVTAAARSP